MDRLACGVGLKWRGGGVWSLRRVRSGALVRRVKRCGRGYSSKVSEDIMNEVFNKGKSKKWGAVVGSDENRVEDGARARRVDEGEDDYLGSIMKAVGYDGSRDPEGGARDEVEDEEYDDISFVGSEDEEEIWEIENVSEREQERIISKYYPSEHDDVEERRGGNLESDVILMQKKFDQMLYGEVVDLYGRFRVSEVDGKVARMYFVALDNLGSREQEMITALKSLKKVKCEIGVEPYAKVIKAYVRIGQPVNALKVYAMMLRDGVAPDIEVYNCLLYMYFHDDPEDFATIDQIRGEIFRSGVECDSATLELLMLGYRRVGRDDLVLEVYADLVESGRVKMTRNSYCMLIEAFLARGKNKQAMRAHKKLESLGLHPHITTYDALIRYHLNSNSKDRAKRLFNEMQLVAKYRPSLNSFKSFLVYCTRKEDWNEFQSIVTDIALLQVTPDYELLELVLRGWYRMRRVKEFCNTFTQMLDRQMKPSRASFTHKMELIGSTLGYEYMISEYEYMMQVGLEPTLYEIRLITSAMYYANRPDLAFEFAESELPKLGLKPDSNDYALKMWCFSRMNAHEYVVGAFDDLSSKNLGFAVEPHILAMRSHLCLGNVRNALEILNEIFAAVRNQNAQLSQEDAARIVINFSHTLSNQCSQIIENIYENVVAHSPESIGRDFLNQLIISTANESPQLALNFLELHTKKYHFVPTYDAYDALFKGIAYQTAKLASNQYFEQYLNLAKEYVNNPLVQPLDIESVGFVLLFLIQHANTDVFSYALAWYNEIFKFRTPQLDGHTSALFRKWMCSLDPAKSANPQYIDRDLKGLSASGAIDLKSSVFLDNNLLVP